MSQNDGCNARNIFAEIDIFYFSPLRPRGKTDNLLLEFVRIQTIIYYYVYTPMGEKSQVNVHPSYTFLSIHGRVDELEVEVHEKMFFKFFGKNKNVESYSMI